MTQKDLTGICRREEGMEGGGRGEGVRLQGGRIPTLKTPPSTKYKSVTDVTVTPPQIETSIEVTGRRCDFVTPRSSGDSEI